MKIQSWLSGVLLLCLALPAQSLPLQTELTPQDLERIERLIALAQRQSPEIKEARAELGLTPFNEVIIVGLNTGLNNFNTNEPEAEPVQERTVGVELYIDLVRAINAVQSYPARRSRLAFAQRQTRVLVVQAYVAYLQARQAWAIAQHQSQPHLNKVDAQSLTATNEVFTANGNERVALENLAAVVGQTPDQILELLR
jgi:hypothetical protein